MFAKLKAALRGDDEPTEPVEVEHHKAETNEQAIFWTEFLTTHEKKHLTDFRAALLARGTLQSGEDSDTTLLRFLMARKWEQADAIAMYETSMKWRKDFGTDSIIETFQYPEIHQVLECYPMFYHGVDRFGRPIYCEKLGDMDVPKLMSVSSKERFLKYHVKEWEVLRKVRLPAASKAAGREIFTSLCVLDLAGTHLSQLNHITRDMVRTVTQLDQDNYPEHLGDMFIINAPMIFSMVWAIVRPLLDDRTKRKIHVLRSSQLDELWDFLSPDQFPAIMGGKCNCKGGCIYSNIGPWSKDGVPGVGQVTSIPKAEGGAEGGAEKDKVEVVEKENGVVVTPPSPAAQEETVQQQQQE